MVHENPFYSVKDICELCNVTRKQLRYYEERGLITPVFRNSDNNYRLYTSQHVTQLFIIREYSLLGYSLSDIQFLLNSNIREAREFFSDWIEKSRRELERHFFEFSRRLYKYRQITNAFYYLDVCDGQHSDVQETDLPATLAVCSNGYGTPFEELETNQLFTSKLYILADRHSLTFTGPLTFHFHQLIDTKAGSLVKKGGEIDVWFPVANLCHPVPEVRMTPAFHCISAIHIGPYDQSLERTYEFLIDHAKKHDILLSGDSIEEYLLGTELTRNAQSFVTRISLPIQASGTA